MVEPFEFSRLAGDQDATAALAQALSAHLRRGDIVGLAGTLGAGKTAFARALIQALGETGEVPSPTFTLVQIYEVGAAPVWHFDLYRIIEPEEVYELGVEEAFADAISIIEWPARLQHLTPASWLEITFALTADPGARAITLRGHGAWAERLRGLADAL